MSLRRIISQRLPVPAHLQGALTRSSHSLAIVGNNAYVFGGEFHPRIPVDANLYIYNLQDFSVNVISPDDSTPCPRVGATLSAIGSKLYLFGGRGGKDMAPLQSKLYAFDTEAKTWETVEPNSGELPSPRSFHAMTASDSDIFVFGGCPEKGRLNDMHKFSLATRAWSALPSPPMTPRGGAAMTYHGHRVYVHGGFTGEEQSDMAVYDTTQGAWSSAAVLSSTTTETTTPGARSVHALVPIPSKDPNSEKLLILFGEGHPSHLGHEGAGEFWGDIWAATLPKSHASANASLPVTYEKVALAASQDDQSNLPCPRGWFQALPWKGNVVLSGGLAASNQRLDDFYMLNVDYA